MATVADNSFEIERRIIMFKPTTSLPDGGTVGFDGNPNLVNKDNSSGELLIYKSPRGTFYDASDGSLWKKKTMPNTWVEIVLDLTGSTGSLGLLQRFKNQKGYMEIKPNGLGKALYDNSQKDTLLYDVTIEYNNNNDPIIKVIREISSDETMLYSYVYNGNAIIGILKE